MQTMLKKLGTLLLGATLAFGTPDSNAQTTPEPDLPPTPSDSLTTVVDNMDPFAKTVIEHTPVRLHTDENSLGGSHTGDTIRLQTLKPLVVYHEIAHGVDADTNGAIPAGNILRDERYTGPSRTTMHEYLKDRIYTADYAVERRAIEAYATAQRHDLLQQTAQDLDAQHDTLVSTTTALLKTNPTPTPSNIELFNEDDTTTTTPAELDSLLTAFKASYDDVQTSSQRADSLEKTILCKAQTDTSTRSMGDIQRLRAQLDSTDQALSDYDTTKEEIRDAYIDLHSDESPAPGLPASSFKTSYMVKVQDNTDTYRSMRYFQDLPLDGPELYARFVSSLYTDGRDRGPNEFHVHDEDLEFLAKQQWNGEPMLKHGISSYQDPKDTTATTRPSQKSIEALDITVEPGFLQTYYSHDEEDDTPSSINCAKYLQD